MLKDGRYYFLIQKLIGLILNSRVHKVFSGCELARL